MKKCREGFEEKYSKFFNEWDIIGKRDRYKCPECQYQGKRCGKHKSDDEETKRWH